MALGFAPPAPADGVLTGPGLTAVLRRNLEVVVGPRDGPLLPPRQVHSSRAPGTPVQHLGPDALSAMGHGSGIDAAVSAKHRVVRLGET